MIILFLQPDVLPLFRSSDSSSRFSKALANIFLIFRIVFATFAAFSRLTSFNLFGFFSAEASNDMISSYVPPVKYPISLSSSAFLIALAKSSGAGGGAGSFFFMGFCRLLVGPGFDWPDLVAEVLAIVVLLVVLCHIPQEVCRI